MSCGRAPSSGSRFLGLLALLRPLNGLMAGAAVLVGALVAAGSGARMALPASAGARVEWAPAALGALAAFGISGAANALNDAVDARSDRTNAPWRPIPRGDATKRAAVLLAVVLYAAGIAIAWPLGPAAVALAAAWVALTALYSFFMKGVPIIGNAAVALVAGSPLLLGGLTQEVACGPVLLVLFGLAALLHFARELYKDAGDVAGDREQGVSTLAVVSGPGAAVALGRSLLMTSMLAAVVPLVAGLLNARYLVFLAPIEALLGWLLYVSRPGTREPAERVARRVSSGLKVVMALGLAAFAAGAW